MRLSQIKIGLVSYKDRGTSQCSPVIFVEGRVNGKAVHQVRIGQVDAAIADEVCMVLLQRFNARLLGVAACCNECALVAMPEHLHIQSLESKISVLLMTVLWDDSPLSINVDQLRELATFVDTVLACQKDCSVSGKRRHRSSLQCAYMHSQSLPCLYQR